VTGTSITLSGLQRFKSSKPECEVVANHLDALGEVSLEPGQQEEEEDDVLVVVPSVENPQHDQQPPPPPPPASQELAAP